MRASRVVALLAATAVAAQVAPAFGAPSLGSLAQRLQSVDKREKRHYAELDRRVKATVLLTRRALQTTTFSARMSEQQPGARTYSGNASCPPGRGIAVGGGAIVAPASLETSAPYGLGWRAVATLGAGEQFVFSLPPTVYVVCATLGLE